MLNDLSTSNRTSIFVKIFTLHSLAYVIQRHPCIYRNIVFLFLYLDTFLVYVFALSSCHCCSYAGFEQCTRHLAQVICVRV